MWVIMPQSTSPCGLGSYTDRSQSNRTAQVACWTLYELCTGAENISGACRGILWRDQDMEREVALARFREQELILLGDLNVDIQSHNPCSQKVTDFLMEFGMVNLHLSGTSRNIVAGKMLLDLWGRLAPLQNGGNKGCG